MPVPEADFRYDSMARRVSVDLKYDILCLRVFVYGIPI